MKKSTVLLFILLQCHIDFGQSHKNLNIPRIGQQTNNWCWAASMEMVMKYHQPTIYVSQSALSVWYDSIRIAAMGRGAPPPLVMLDTLNYASLKKCDAPPMSSQQSHLNSKPKRFRGTISIDYNVHPSSFESLFKSRGYNAEQTITPTNSWEVIKNQIDLCKPVIIIEGIKTTSTSSAHIVVAYGYNSIENPENQQVANVIAIHDPWPCSTGTTYIISDQYLKVDCRTRLPVGEKKGILSIIKNINPSNETGSCNTFEDTLSKELSEYFVKPDTINALETKLYYISPEKLRITNFNTIVKRPLHSMKYDVLYKEYSLIKYKKDIVYQYEFFDKNLSLGRVSKNSQLNLEPTFILNDKKITLSNRGKGIRYSLIEEVISGDRYFRFMDNYKIYLVPIDNANKYNDPKINNDYLEKNVLKNIKDMTLNMDK